MEKRNSLAIWLPPNFDPDSPSVRLRRLNLRKPLRKAGIRTEFIFRYEDLLAFDHILMMNFSPEIVIQCTELRKLGKRLYFCHSEQIFGLDCQEQVFNLCDYIVCCTNKLARLTEPHITSSFTKCVVIEDMLETPRPSHQPKETEKLKVVWCGMGGNSYLARKIQPIIENLGMELVIISEHSDANIKWGRETYLQDMANCDIVICPQNVELQPAKSHVKVATAMGLGMPFVCSPSPAYSEIVRHKANGYIATTDQEWKDALLELKDFTTRKRVAFASRMSAMRFEPQTIAANWKALLERKHTRIALINNTLPVKYWSYGDKILEDLQFAGYDVECFRYEDVDDLPKGFDYYLFIEVRYDPYKISDVSPKILFTKEKIDINSYVPFDLIVTEDSQLAKVLTIRGFCNIVSNLSEIKEFTFDKYLKRRKEHNYTIHTNNTNSLYKFHFPEERWAGGNRDKAHIAYVNKYLPGAEERKAKLTVLDLASADGWLSLYCAHAGAQVSALEFVERGISWTQEQAKRLKVTIDLKSGFLEDTSELFKGKQFDLIFAFEILEHIDLLKIEWYLQKLEELLAPSGKILISLPKQNMAQNVEHMWSPSEELVKKIFKNKKACSIEWVPISNHEIEGNWFISYMRESLFTRNKI